MKMYLTLANPWEGGPRSCGWGEVKCLGGSELSFFWGLCLWEAACATEKLFLSGLNKCLGEGLNEYVLKDNCRGKLLQKFGMEKDPFP